MIFKYLDRRTLQWGAFYLFIAEFFSTYNIGGSFVIKWRHQI